VVSWFVRAAAVATGALFLLALLAEQYANANR
jgi:hypothetical protein